MNTSFIEKELVSYQRFSKGELLSEGNAIAQGRNKLERSVTLANVYKVKSKIFS